MTILFNISPLKRYRKKLRNNSTRTEIYFWIHVKNKQFLGLKFRRQYSIGRFIVDFYCTQYKLAIELDGNIHLRKDIRKYDKRRQKFIESFGITVLRFDNRAVLDNIELVFKTIESYINEVRSSDPPAPPFIE